MQPPDTGALSSKSRPVGPFCADISTGQGALHSGIAEVEVEMNRIRAARQALGLTQGELAKSARVSARTIHAVEQGSACRQTTKRQILRALKVPWELRDEYFPWPKAMRRVRRPSDVRQASGI